MLVDGKSPRGNMGVGGHSGESDLTGFLLKAGQDDQNDQGWQKMRNQSDIKDG